MYVVPQVVPDVFAGKSKISQKRSILLTNTEPQWPQSCISFKQMYMSIRYDKHQPLQSVQCVKPCYYTWSVQTLGTPS
jgi:hypothetical protein